MSLKILQEVNFNLNKEEKNAILKAIQNPNNNIDTKLLMDALDVENFQSEPNSLVLQDSKSNATHFNDFFNNTYLDLVQLFKEDQVLDKLILDNKHLSNSMIDRIKEDISKIKDKVEAHKLLNDRDGYNGVERNSFSSLSEFNQFNFKNKYLYRDHVNNRQFNRSEVSNYDKLSEGINLTNSGEITPNNINVRITYQTGEGFIEEVNKDFEVDSITNLNLDNIWREIISSSEELDVPSREPIFNSLKNAALCKITMTFDQVAPLNEITLNPFSEYPMMITGIYSFNNTNIYNEYLNKLKEIKSYEFIDFSDVDKMNFNRIVHPNSENYDLLPFKLTSAKTIQFKSINSKIIEIGIAQQNYKIIDQIIREDQKHQVELYDSLSSDKKGDMSLSFSEFSDNLYSKVKKESLGIIKSLVYNISSLIPGFDLEKLTKITQEKNKKREIKNISRNKYMYEYGFSSIIPRYRKYNLDSIYLSDLYEFNNNVRIVKLNVKDFNPSIPVENFGLDHLKVTGVDYLPATSIEYYLTNRERPTDSEWIPILPEEYNGQVEAERIYPSYIPNKDKEYFDCQLRFPSIENTIIIIKNYNNEVEWEYLSEQKIRIKDRWSDSNVYTVNYKASKDCSIIDFVKESSPVPFMDEDGLEGEVFELGTDADNKIKLSNMPYIDFSQITNTDNYVQSSDPQHNPTENTLNPNYSKGYIPINVSMEGHAEFNGQLYSGEFKNDKKGIPYIYYRNQKDYDDQRVTSEEIRREDNEPYFYNKTNYMSNTHTSLTSYDSFDYPVFDYLHHKDNIYFTDTFNDSGSQNKGTVRVKYNLLVEGVRMKIVMRRNSRVNNGLTPIVYDYTLRTRNLRH